MCAKKLSFEFLFCTYLSVYALCGVGTGIGIEAEIQARQKFKTKVFLHTLYLTPPKKHPTFHNTRPSAIQYAIFYTYHCIQ